MPSAVKTVSATYKYHYNTFGMIGPHCAIADVDVKNGSAIVYATGQAVGAGQGGPGGAPPAQMSTVLASMTPPINIPANQIRSIWYEGSGSYGGGQIVQAAEEALVISATIGKPVRLQWMRWDVQGWDHWGPAHMYDIKMGADASGRIVASDITSYGQAGTGLDTTRELLGQILARHPRKRRADAVRRRLDRDSLRQYGLRLGVPVQAAGPGEVPAALRRRIEDERAAGAEHAAVVLRERADRRRARLCDEHGPHHVPQAERRRSVGRRCPLSGDPRRSRDQSRLQAAGGVLGPAEADRRGP